MSHAPRGAPSSRNRTPTTPTLSEALAVTAIVPETPELEVGKVIDTVGGVLSLKTVTVTGSEGYQTPSASSAMARSVWDPLAAVFVSQGTEYGAEVSASPRSAPSRRNCTRCTRTPSGLTLALTVIAPPTVDPSAGEVTFTIRPLTWAEAADGQIQAAPRIAPRAAARPSLAWCASAFRFITAPFPARALGLHAPCTALSLPAGRAGQSTSHRRLKVRSDDPWRQRGGYGNGVQGVAEFLLRDSPTRRRPGAASCPLPAGAFRRRSASRAPSARGRSGRRSAAAPPPRTAQPAPGCRAPGRSPRRGRRDRGAVPGAPSRPRPRPRDCPRPGSPPRAPRRHRLEQRV